jgi:hypothetical protein
MADDRRVVTLYTQSQRRPLRIGEDAKGERLRWSWTTHQIIAFFAAAFAFGPPAMVAQHFVWGAGIVGFILIPACVGRVVGAIQDAGNAPAVSAHNGGRIALVWSQRMARRFRRPERVTGKTRVIVRDVES